jgi:hypothetical protein
MDGRQEGERTTCSLFTMAGERQAPEGGLYRVPEWHGKVRPFSRPRFWIGGIVAVMLALAAGACGTGDGNDLPTQRSTHRSPPTVQLSQPSGASQPTASPSSHGIPVVSGDMPVLIDSAMYQQAADDGYTYAFPGELTTQQVATLNNLPLSFQSYITQVTSLGGTNIKDTDVQIGLRGNATGQTAVIVGLEVIKKCGTPLTGTLLFSPSAGEDNNIEIGFNLDDQFPVAQNYQGTILSGNFFAEHTISLRQGETQSLLVHAVTRQYYCQFTYRLLVDTGNREVAELITDNGKPFTVTAGVKSGNYQVLYVGGVASPAGNDKYVPVDPKAYNQSAVSP